MKRGRVDTTYQTLLWGAVLGLASLLRLVSLGWPPLGDVEAASALSAAKGGLASPFWNGSGAMGTSASYQSLTGLVYQLVGTSTAAARWIPALAGVGLIILTYRLRHRIGQVRAVLLALLLTISPASLDISRSAGSTSLAVLGVAMFVAFALVFPGAEPGVRRFAWMGVGLGLALASGPAAWDGLVCLAAAYGWLRWRGKAPKAAVRALPAGAWRVFGLALGVTFLGLTVQFGAGMDGLGVAMQAPAQWLAGWVHPGNMALLTGMALLPAYGPLVLAFGVVGAFSRSEDDVVWAGARVWALSGMVLFVLRTGRSPEDLVWVVLPLAALATLPLSKLISILTGGLEDITVYIMAGVLAALAGFTYLQLAGYINEVNVGGSPEVVTLGLVLTAIGFALSLFLLYGMTWSWTEAFHATGSVGALVLTLLTLAAGWRLAFTPQSTGGPELWRPTSASPDIGLLEATLAQVAMAYKGEEVGLPVQVQGPVPASLAWILRHETLAPSGVGGASPAQAILLPVSDSTPSLPGAYLGQRFGVESTWGWGGPLPPDAFGWWILRKGGTRTVEWVLYVHSDSPVQPQGGDDGGDNGPPAS